MKFEHIENAYPNDEFDRLGSKEDAKLPFEKKKELALSIEDLKLKIKQLENDIMIMAEDDFINREQHIQEKNLELQDRQTELKGLLQKSDSLNNSLDQEGEPFNDQINNNILKN